MTCDALDAGANFNLFNSTFADIMKSIVPSKYKNHKSAPVPWRTDTTHTLRQVCSWAEHQWKNDLLQKSSYEILKKSYNLFQKLQRPQNANIFSQIMIKNVISDGGRKL